MATQGLFCRTPILINSCRLLLNKRSPQLTLTSGVKQKAVDLLKKLKVPERPKKPLTPYFRFLQEHRNSIIKKYPDWKVTQISVQCASDWKTLDSSTKEKYEQAYKADLEQYTKKYLNYTNSLTEEQKEALNEYNQEVKNSKVKREKRKRIRENDKPKRPLGAYMLYVMDNAKSQPGKNFTQLLTDLKGKWAELPEGEKEKYALKAAKAKEQYEKDLKQWEVQMIEKGNLDLVRQSTLADKGPVKTK